MERQDISNPSNIKEKQERGPPDGAVSSSELSFVPQLARHKITLSELETAVRVLNAVSMCLNPRKQQQKKNRKKRASKSNENLDGTANNGGQHDQQTDGVGDEQQQDSLLEEYKKPNLRPLRKALAECLALHRRTMFNGKEEEEHYEQRKLERSLKRQKMAESALHKQYIASTALRSGRMERLKQLQQAQPDEAKEDASRHTAITAHMIPDGHVETTTTAPMNPCNEQEVEGDRLLEDGESSNKSDPMRSAVPESNSEVATTKEQLSKQPVILLPKLRSCYVCKIRFRQLHHFYDQHCPKCAAENWAKRHQTANLKGYVAVVTGARVKIGFHTALKLLRAGCTVIATTRFPNAAVAAYRQCSDFETWKDRLRVYGLDLRDVIGIEAFVHFLKQRHGHGGGGESSTACGGIDILVHNACQTVRRQAAYYQPAIQKEQSLWQRADDGHKACLRDCIAFERVRRKLVLGQQRTSSAPTTLQPSLLLTSGEDPSSTPEPALALTVDQSERNPEMQEAQRARIAEGCANTEKTHLKLVKQPKESSNQKTHATRTTDMTTSSSVKTPFETNGLSHSAAMSQMVVLPEDTGCANGNESSAGSVLPAGYTDINGQQLDLRTTNSWLLQIHEVSTPEVMECFLINAMAPFVLNSRLVPLMTNFPEDASQRPDRYIINVSAMEGKFHRYKTPNHPHTNMAKAALNMLTRTSAEHLAVNHRIFMNSVDTGWINDENPLAKASRTAERNNFQTPIDEVDAASRILDPVFTGVNGGKDTKKEYGKFLKDYHETEW